MKNLYEMMIFTVDTNSYFCHYLTIGIGIRPYDFPIRLFVGFFIEKYYLRQIFFLHIQFFQTQL